MSLIKSMIEKDDLEGWRKNELEGHIYRQGKKCAWDHRESKIYSIYNPRPGYRYIYNAIMYIYIDIMF